MAELEQFCLLAKAQKGRACAALVQQVLSHKKIFHFAELLEIPSVYALKDSEFDKCFKSLELFAYGTVDTYLANPSHYIELTDLQFSKLQTLTLLTLCGSSKHLQYEELLFKLHVTSIRTLEDLIIEALYAGLVRGKLDQALNLFKVESCTSRDVKMENLENILSNFRLWKSKCNILEKAMFDNNQIIHTSRTACEVEQVEIQKNVDETKKKIKESLDAGIEISELEGILAGKSAKSGKSHFLQHSQGRGPFGGKAASRGRL